MATNQEYQRLRDIHNQYSVQLEQLSCKSYLSEQEQIEEVRLKKLKLQAKDKMEWLVRQAQSS